MDCSGAGTGATCGDSEVCPELEFCDDGFTDACGFVQLRIAQRQAVVPPVVTVRLVLSLSFVTMALPTPVVAAMPIAPAAGAGQPAVMGSVCPELEFCDDGYTDACGSCNADCSAAGTASVCGDGTLCPELEFCDDGNTDSCDGCYGDCSRADNVCGDSILECAETCDDGNALDDGNGCSALCQREGSCGDGIIQPLFEVCDDGFSLMPVVPVTRTAPVPAAVLPAAMRRSVQNLSSATMASSMPVEPVTPIVAGGTGATCGDAQVCPELEFCDDGYTRCVRYL